MKFLIVALGVLTAVNATGSTNPIEEEVERKLYHLGCGDDPTYNSPIAADTPCSFFDNAICECSAWNILMTHDELQDLFTSCPHSCKVTCDYVVDNTPSISPTAKGPTSSPTRNNSGCHDDPSYSMPLMPQYGCNFYSESTISCDQWNILLTAAQIEEAKERCPLSCNEPCEGNVPTASPIECVDDELYVSPINTKYGCKLYCDTDCNMWHPLLTGLEMEDVLSSCPLSCGLCGSSAPSMEPSEDSGSGPSTMNPTPSPTSSLTTKPSTKPSPSPSSGPTGSPFACVDDPDYVSPINANAGCELYSPEHGICDCDVWAGLMSSEDALALFQQCPVTCGVCDPGSATPSISPDTCVDDPDYRNPLGLGCTFHGQSNLSCEQWVDRFGLSPDDQALLMSCPLACGLCDTPVPSSAPTDGTGTNDPPTSSPTKAPVPMPSVLPTNAPTVHLSSSPSTGPTISASPTDCTDDRSYVSPITGEQGCDSMLVGELPDCHIWRTALTGTQFGDLFKMCPKTCNVSCDYTPPTTVSPTAIPSASPSQGPTISASPTDCTDDRSYVHPITGVQGCDSMLVGELLDCHIWRTAFTEKQFEDLFKMCPKTCNVSCDYTPPPTESPTAIPSASPSQGPTVSASPTDCADDQDYDNPLFVNQGCNVMSMFPNCHVWRASLTSQQFEDLFKMCPKTCNVSCDYTPPPTESPTAIPSTSPSQGPTVSASPTDCANDQDYDNPINGLEGCDQMGPDCHFWRTSMTAQQFEDLFKMCPKTCNVSCDYTPPPTESPTAIPSASPSQGPTVSASPTDCFDDPAYVHPIYGDQGQGCDSLGINCHIWRSVFSEADFEDMFHRCSKTCNVSCDYTPPPTEAPSSHPTTSVAPSQGPTSLPTVMPTNCPSFPSECAAHICVEKDNTNIALSGQVTTSVTETVHWWQVALSEKFYIHQIKIFACTGDLCEPEGKKLNQIRVDVMNELVTVATFYFYNDQGPIMDLILPFEIEGTLVKVSKMDVGKVLSLSEVQVIGHSH